MGGQFGRENGWEKVCEGEEVAAAKKADSEECRDGEDQVKNPGPYKYQQRARFDKA